LAIEWGNVEKRKRFGPGCWSTESSGGVHPFGILAGNGLRRDPENYIKLASRRSGIGGTLEGNKSGETNFVSHQGSTLKKLISITLAKKSTWNRDLLI